MSKIEEILKDTLNRFYDYITERDIIKVAHEYSEKTLYKDAVKDLEKLVLEARKEELTVIKDLDEPAQYFQDGKRYTGLAIPRNKIIRRIAELKARD